MSTHNIGFSEEITKLIFQLSSNMHLICSSDVWLTLSSKPSSVPRNLFKIGKVDSLIKSA